MAALKMPSFASSSSCPEKARLEISSATVNPMPAMTPPPRIVGQLSTRRIRPSRAASHVPATMPTGLPTT